MPPLHVQLLARFCNFYYKSMNSDNVLVKLCSKICVGGTAAAANRRLLFKCVGNNINEYSKLLVYSIHAVTEDEVATSLGCVVRELCQVREMASWSVIYQ